MVNELIIENQSQPSTSTEEEKEGESSWTLVVGKRKKQGERRRSKSLPTQNARTSRRVGAPRRSSLESQRKPSPINVNLPLPVPASSPTFVKHLAKVPRKTPALPPRSKDYKPAEFLPAPSPTKVFQSAQDFPKQQPDPSPVSLPKPTPVPVTELTISADSSSGSISGLKPKPIYTHNPVNTTDGRSSPPVGTNFPQVDKDGQFLTPPAVKRELEFNAKPLVKTTNCKNEFTKKISSKKSLSQRSDYKAPIHFSCSSLNPNALPYSTPPLIESSPRVNINNAYTLIGRAAQQAPAVPNQPTAACPSPGYPSAAPTLTTALQATATNVAYLTPSFQPVPNPVVYPASVHSTPQLGPMAAPQAYMQTQYLNQTGIYYSPQLTALQPQMVVPPMQQQQVVNLPVNQSSMMYGTGSPMLQPMQPQATPTMQIMQPQVNPPPIQMTPSSYSSAMGSLNGQGQSPPSMVSSQHVTPNLQGYHPVQTTATNQPLNHRSKRPTIVTLPFNSTSIGLELDDYDFTKIGKVDPNKQGAQYGIAVGWRVTHVDSVPVFASNILTHLEMANPDCFYLTFEVPSQDANNVFYHTNFQNIPSKDVVIPQTKMEGLDALEEMYANRGRNSATSEAGISEATSFGSPANTTNWQQCQSRPADRNLQGCWYEPTAAAPIPTAAGNTNPNDWLM